MCANGSFREGNGRTQREFLRLLANEKGIPLNLNPPDNKSVYERYMKGIIHSDIPTLTKLIFELIEKPWLWLYAASNLFTIYNFKLPGLPKSFGMTRWWSDKLIIW